MTQELEKVWCPEYDEEVRHISNPSGTRRPMTEPQQQNPNELLSITREELERCCSQMSAAGYKVSANYIEASVLSRSRPAPAPQCPYEITYCQTHDCIRCKETVERIKAQAATAAREDVLFRIYKPPTADNVKDGWNLNVKWLSSIHRNIRDEDDHFTLEDVEVVLMALQKSLEDESLRQHEAHP